MFDLRLIYTHVKKLVSDELHAYCDFRYYYLYRYYRVSE
jgi:hypothetical protein